MNKLIRSNLATYEFFFHGHPQSANVARPHYNNMDSTTPLLGILRCEKDERGGEFNDPQWSVRSSEMPNNLDNEYQIICTRQNSRVVNFAIVLRCQYSR
jgi:hypothetical protein